MDGLLHPTVAATEEEAVMSRTTTRTEEQPQAPPPPALDEAAATAMESGVGVSVDVQKGDDPLAGVGFRPLREGDLEEIKALHEALFPVRYSQAFYDCAVRGYMCGTLQPLRSLVAIKEGQGMVGVVIAQLLPTEECGDPELVWPEHAYTEVMYILTLGTLPEYRRLGLGKLLLRKAMEAGAESPRCGAVYLHVITYNEAAQKFYEANGFRRLRTLKDYYVIEEQRYDSYLYIRHINRALDPKLVTWVDGLLRPFVDWARALSFSLHALKKAKKQRAAAADGGGGGQRGGGSSSSSSSLSNSSSSSSGAAAAAAIDPAGGGREEKEQRGGGGGGNGGLLSPLGKSGFGGGGKRWLGALPKHIRAAPPPPPVPPPRLGHPAGGGGGDTGAGNARGSPASGGVESAV